VNGGCVLQLLFPDRLHNQHLRRPVDSRDQGNKGRKSEHDRRDEDDNTDEGEKSYGNQALIVRLYTTTLFPE